MSEHKTFVNLIPAFQDNYIWAIHCHRSCAIVDPGDAKPVLAYLGEHELSLTHILITHHHNDHIGGIAELVKHFPDVSVVGIRSKRLPHVNHIIEDEDEIALEELDMRLKVKSVPGHTRDHIIFHNDHYLFCGDTLFSGGCGRLFEGTPQQMNQSLQYIASLDPSIKVCCAHEYTLANLSFALHLEPSNLALIAYQQEAIALREASQPTLPSTIGKEIAINPFLRCDSEEIAHYLAQHATQKSITYETTFEGIRKLKDVF